MSDNPPPKSETIMRPAAVRILRDELDGRTGAMTLALTRHLLRSRGGKHAIKYQPRSRQERRFIRQHDDRADDYRGMGIGEIAAECIGYDGRIQMGRRGPTRSSREHSNRLRFSFDFRQCAEQGAARALRARGADLPEDRRGAKFQGLPPAPAGACVRVPVAAASARDRRAEGRHDFRHFHKRI